MASIRTSHKSKSWFILHLLFLPVYLSYRAHPPPPHWCISMRVWGAWRFSGWLNSFASHFLAIYMQVCVCVYCNLWVSTMASNAFPLHRWDNGNARVNSVPQVDCNWISVMSGANLRSGELQPSCPPIVWLYYDPSALLGWIEEVNKSVPWEDGLCCAKASAINIIVI